MAPRASAAAREAVSAASVDKAALRLGAVAFYANWHERSGANPARATQALTGALPVGGADCPSWNDDGDAQVEMTGRKSSRQIGMWHRKRHRDLRSIGVSIGEALRRQL